MALSEQVQNILTRSGTLAVNGEAIYQGRPWRVSWTDRPEFFSERASATRHQQDFRYTMRDERPALCYPAIKWKDRRADLAVSAYDLKQPKSSCAHSKGKSSLEKSQLLSWSQKMGTRLHRVYQLAAEQPRVLRLQLLVFLKFSIRNRLVLYACTHQQK